MRHETKKYTQKKYEKRHKKRKAMRYGSEMGNGHSIQHIANIQSLLMQLI